MGETRPNHQHRRNRFPVKPMEGNNALRMSHHKAHHKNFLKLMIYNLILLFSFQVENVKIFESTPVSVKSGYFLG